MIPAKTPAPVRMGVVAETASLSERLTRIESKLDLVRMLTPLFANPSMRVAIGTAVTTQALKVRK